MQRADPDCRGRAASRGTGEHCEISEVPDPPIACTAQTIELAAQPPAPRPRPECRGQVAAVRRDYQYSLGSSAAHQYFEAVVAKRQAYRQRQDEPSFA